MFGLTLRVISKDGETEVAVTPRISVEFERQFQTGIGRAFQDQKLEHIYWLAWRAAGSPNEFETWLDGLVDVQIVEQVERPLSDSPQLGS